MTIDVYEGERIDELHRNGYRIIQKKDGFCFGMDAVLLSGFAAVKEGERALDLGCGTGIIPLLLEAKTRGRHFTGLEIDIIEGDIKEAGRIFGGASFDVVTANPPYMNDSHGLKNPDLPRAIARHEVLCTLQDVVREAAKVLRPGGRFYLVHRPRRLIEIITELAGYGLEPKRLKFVHPFADREAKMVLIEAARGGRSFVRVEKPLIVFRERGIYTDEINEIYGY